MKERPILFSGPMVRAILEGRKTQTRRIMKRKFPFGEIEPNVTSLGGCPVHFPDGSWENEWCPYGWQGSRLWVRETWAQKDDMLDCQAWLYRADETARFQGYGKPGAKLDTYGWAWDKVKWKTSIFMPRDASRITLEITNIRCERLQDISESDAISEGIEPLPGPTENKPLYPLYGTKSKFVNDRYTLDPKMSYVHLWQSINGPESWKENPFVWVIEFKRV